MVDLQKVFQHETNEVKGAPSLRLAVIADDMTGALDTGVQFSQRGARVAIVPAGALRCGADTQVAVVNAESRHLSPRAAYGETLRIARWALEAGAAYLYIKTDSGMRGNIGPALKAALDASGAELAAFAPAYPDMRRVTRNGCQLVDGLPIDQSVFGADPVDPVRHARVQDIIRWDGLRMADVPRAGVLNGLAEPTVLIFDVEENADFVRIARLLQLRGGLRVTAGCAAFAAALISWLDLPRETPGEVPAVREPLLVLCGSLNPITRQQMLCGVRMGAWHGALDGQSLLRDDWMSACGDTLAAARREMGRGRTVLLDTCGGLPEGDLRKTSGLIADRMGSLAEYLLSLPEARGHTPMIIGGDTLMGFLSRQNMDNIRIEGEVAPGVVAFQLQSGGRPVRILSKSGGFGRETLLADMMASGRMVRC